MAKYDVGQAAVTVLSQGCPLLESLCFSYGVYPSSSILLNLLCSCRQLTALHVSFLEDSDEVLAELAENFPALRELGMSYSLKISRHIASWPLLRHLELPLTPLDDDMLRMIAAHCPHLQTIKAENCHLVTDAGVTALAKGCPQLQDVELRHSDYITIAALEAITAHCRYLERLSINQYMSTCEITTEQMGPYRKYVGDINSHNLADR
jgi:hypothetical protein